VDSKKALALSVAGGLVGCARAKVKLKHAVDTPPPAADVVVVLPDDRSGLVTALGEMYDLETAGEALSHAADTVSRRVKSNRSEATSVEAGSGAVWSAPRAPAKDGAKWGEWYEAALTKAVPGDLNFRVVDEVEALTVLDCDYVFTLMAPSEEERRRRRIPGAQMLKGYSKMGKVYGSIYGISSKKGEWELARCRDGEVLGRGAMKHSYTRMWWALQFRKSQKIKLMDNAFEPLTTDLRDPAAEADRTLWPSLAANIASERGEAASADAPGTRMGVTPVEEGDFASPYMADGSLAKWDLRLMFGSLAGAATEELTKAAVRKVAGSGRVADKVGEFGGGLAGGLVENSITSKLKADHYFEDVCSLAVWLDTSYAHRGDYLFALSTATQVYPDLRSTYRSCLFDAAKARAGE